MGKADQIDDLDLRILSALMQDARKPFLELAKELEVSGGTIHVRVNKLKELGIIKGSAVEVDYKALGMQVCCFIGINLHSASDYPQALEALQALPQVLEAYYTTGDYTIFIKALARTNEDLHNFLTKKLQRIEGVRSTDTLLVLDDPIKRNIDPLQFLS